MPLLNDVSCKHIISTDDACVYNVLLIRPSVVETVQEEVTTSIKVGDLVRVKPAVKTPKYKWGSVTHDSVGQVTGQACDTPAISEHICVHV